MTNEAATQSDRVTEVRVRGARTIVDATLGLGHMNVLIGPNGAGKSTIVEAIEILRWCGHPQPIQQSLYQSHEALRGLIRHGERDVSFGVTINGAGPRIRYDVTFGVGRLGQFSIESECLLLGPRQGHSEPLRVLTRNGVNATFFKQAESRLDPIPNLSPGALAIHSFGSFAPNDAINRLITVLQGITVHVPFEVRPAWSNPRELPGLRSPNLVQKTDRLEMFGRNLANVWFRLKNDFGRRVFEAAMDDVRAGLGRHIEDVSTEADAGGGTVALKVRFDDGSNAPAFSLSDGMLSYLAFVALCHLPDAGRSILVFDEPELHLHPELLVRVVSLFENISRNSTVLLSTHSDRLLDALSDPGSSVVLCDLDSKMHTRLLRPNTDVLASWLQDFRGIGTLRTEGYDRSVFTMPASTSSEESA